MTSKEATVDEDISSEKYEGTISKVIPKSSEKEVMYSRYAGCFGFIFCFGDVFFFFKH